MSGPPFGMEQTCGRSVVLLTLLLQMTVQFAKVDASYRFYVRAHTYSNPNHRVSNGDCCDFGFFADQCDNYFEFCLRSRGTVMSSALCTLGFYTSQGTSTGDDSTFESLIGNLDNPLVYTGNNWPGGFQLRVSVYDHDSFADDLVDQIFAERDLEVNQSYTTVSSYTGTYGQGTMELSFKVECAQFYYGLDCMTFCEPTDNSSGHYSCDDNGNKVCLDGWVDASTNCLTFVVNQSVSVLPDILWVSNGGIHNVAEGHVIQVYCSATNTIAPTIRWEKDVTEIFQDPPHIFIRTSVNGTTTSSVLTIDPFNSTDDGAYTCIATVGSMSASSSLLSLTTISSSELGSLTITRQPADNERNDNSVITDSDVLYNNRTGVRVRDVDPSGISNANRLMRCIAGHVGGASAVSTPPTLVWTRSGEAVVADGTHIIITDTQQGDQLQSNLQINSFTDSDAGIYQCIYTDSDSDAEVATSLPHRLDYGNVLHLSSISPSLVVIVPPEKLILEVQSSGAYNYILWKRNGLAYLFPPWPFPSTPDRFFYFFDAYVREPTSEEHLGLYEVRLVEDAGQNDTDAPIQSFTVARYVVPITTTQSPTQTVMEGGNVTLTCISEGTPTPTFTWRLNGEDIPTNRHTETFTDPAVDVDQQADIINNFTNGTAITVLTISVAVFPDDDGVYECIGTNSHGGVNNSCSAFTMLTVQVEPEVEVSATPQARIALGQSVSLFCNVTRANPNVNLTYVWRIVSVSTLTEETNTLVLSNITADQFGTYQCEVTNDAGSGSATISIEQGFLPSVSVDQPAPVVIGTSVVMNCSASGDTPISYVWEQVVQGGVVLSKEESFTLMVANVSQYGMYRCTATNILGSDSGTVDVVQAFELEVEVSATPQARIALGQSVSLFCNVTRASPAVGMTYVWRIDGGPPLAEETDTLVVSNIMANQFGTYSCEVTNDVGSDTGIITIEEEVPGMPVNFDIRVDGPRTLTFSWDHPLGFETTGAITAYRLSCDPEPVGFPKVFTPQDFNEEGVVYTDNVFTPLTTYNCCTTASSGGRDGPLTSAMATTLDDTMLLQVQITGVPDCSSWATVMTQEKIDDIQDELQNQINSLCTCGFTPQHITTGELQCFTSSDEVTYRTRLSGTTSVNSSEILGYLEEWVTSGTASILVLGFRLNLDSSCLPVAIDSLADPECIGTGESDESSDNTIATLGAVGGGVALVLTAAVLLIIVIACLLMRRRRHFSVGKREKSITMTESAAYMAAPPLPPRRSITNQGPPVYEMIAMQNPAYSVQQPQDYEMASTRNPAYGVSQDQSKEVPQDYEMASTRNPAYGVSQDQSKEGPQDYEVASTRNPAYGVSQDQSKEGPQDYEVASTRNPAYGVSQD